jgi:transcriptional regulator with XRE-family HTH domain
MEKRARKLLAQKLRVLRFMRGWSQENLAAASGLHRTYISAIERGERNISLDNIEKLADAFGLSIKELLAAPDPAKLAKLLDYQPRQKMRRTKC